VSAAVQLAAKVTSTEAMEFTRPVSAGTEAEIVIVAVVA